MLAASGQKTTTVPGRQKAGPKVRARTATALAEAQRTLEKGDILFHEGESRVHPYRVESGAVCHYMNWQDGHHDVIEFAFPGDIIGFGGLPKHVSTAQAIVDTAVSPLSELDFEQALTLDAQLAARFAAAADREFDFLRDRALGDGLPPPVSRVAAYLLAVSGLEAHEKRDGSILLEPVLNSYVAESLHLPLPELAEVVGELTRRGAVCETAAGLIIQDRQALERAVGEH